ncbi:MAG TPA: porin family protein, partial [Ignavibacteria bacterium]|nr:porin family protein [Ignavibacteria bacterium]
MNSRNLLIFISFIILSAADLKSQTTVGLIGGLNIQSISGDAPQNASYGSKTGYMFGLSAETNITKEIKIVLQPNYSVYRTIISYDIGREDPVDSMNVKMSYFRVPVLAKLEAFNGVTYFLSGLDFGFLQDSKIQDINKTSEEKDISESFEKFDLAAAFGVGVKFPVKRFVISAEGRYSQSLFNLS